ncbi:hypothetical protein KKC83_05695 [Patescibacteria group bacterium]|nr:hypothetical protein [Candidatus Falkowbacteria bacterium]MBU3906597.1 hypothetical protein [Patescibacteria group bacterium]MBU4014585.1 hypothetical protein [Patescibacteria group bacterium]MBU4027009.1 hypothetical protein [Patescibacteria group bacterium]MBU4073579.1 hypothetical protein [Patescibacteria group bacterium]
MKTQFIIFLIFIFILGLMPINFSNAADLASRLKGRILLQVQSHGEAWYVHSDTGEGYYLGRPDDAFRVMRELGLGISNKDFDSFKGAAPKRLSGRILLKVEDKGKAYYINPIDLKMHYLGRPADAFEIMRKLGVGISDADFSEIPIAGEGSIAAEGNTTLLKSYRLLVFTKINGAWPTKDGGYIVSGTTDPNIMFIPPDGFTAKLDQQGNIQWLKFLKTANSAGDGNPLGDEDVQSIIELKDGGYLMASKVWGFIKSEEWSTDDIELNKIMLTRLDKDGNMIWNKSFAAFVEDAKNSLLETDDRGFLFYANILDLDPDERGEDADVYLDQPYASLKVFKLDQDGNLQWSKNIKNFIARGNDSLLIPTPDGGYALAGNLTEINPEKELPYNFDTYPGLAKFDKNFNFEWAKSLESTPLEMAAAIPKPGGGFELGWKKVRQAASIIRGLVQTQDNGYLVLGNLSGALSLITDSQDLKSGMKGYLIGFKFDSSGNMEWVKKISLGFNEFSMPMTDFSISLTTDNDIMIAGPITWADEDYQAKVQYNNEQIKLYNEKYGEAEMSKEDNEKTEESRQDYKKVLAVIKSTQDSFRAGIFMMKTDQELNISWAKIINPQRGAVNYVLKPTPDNGAIIAGEYETEVVKSVILSSITYYKDGFLMKLDASGNVKNNVDWVADYNEKIITEIMTPYAVSNDLSAQAESYSINLTNRNPEFSFYKNAKTSVYAPFASYKDLLPPQAPLVSAYDTPLQNSTGASTAARTWPQINYEKAIPSELVNDKSRTVHGELLPILNQLYDDQVKMTDNMDGAMLYYVFDRIITQDDIAAVKNYLEGVGYKTQDEGLYELTTYKPGYFLILTFSTNNADKAFLKVTY